MILYEYPFNEGIRTMLRLEHLFDRLGQLMARDGTLDHHFALATIFEIADVGSRADLKSDLLKELERQRGLMHSYRTNPSVAQGRLDTVIDKIDGVWQRLNALPGKAGAELNGHEWLMAIRSRISIPGGTCEFDLPAYHAWQQRDPSFRRAELMQWMSTLMPFAEALSLLLGLMREGGVPSMVVAVAGQYTQSLPAGRVFSLMRVRLDVPEDIVPEISAHRLMASVRLMQQDAQYRLRQVTGDVTFELTLCS